MAEALVSLLVEQLGSILGHELEQEVRLVVGVEDEVKKLESKFTAIKAVLADAETRQVKEATVRDWLEKLRDVAYDIEDVLDDWEAAILSSQSKPGQKRKVCSFLRSSCFCCKQVRLRHDIADKIKELNGKLDLIAQEKELYIFVSKAGNQPIERPMTTSMIDIIEVKGREEDKSVLINTLLSDGDKLDLRVLSMVGMGGIGKTTLAQFAFNHDKIKMHFDKKIWICVSDPFDERRVAEAIYESLIGHTPNVRQLQSLLEKIGESIVGKKFLLVLDDVWEENPRKWDQLKQSLKYGSSGSKVLVTTRKENVALIMGCSKHDILKVGILSDEECWLIVSKIAFFGKSEAKCKNLEKIGKEISKKCRGLPLAAKALGGILQFRKTKEEWQSILGSDVWELEGDVFAPLWLSYYDLSPVLKRCFSYCAIFPKGYEIEKKKLIELWMAQGYLKQGQSHDLEVIGEYYFQNLAMRSFFQNFKKDFWDDHIITRCKMHDIVHDLAQIIARNECHSAQVNDSEELIREVRHLHLPTWEPYLNTYLNISGGFQKKRSLLLQSWATTEELSSLFGELTHVRSLSLRDGDFEEIPSSISKLVHLRWLDLSDNNELKQLPETLCELHNLQTLDVSLCSDGLELPLEIGKLINLRHLHNIEGPSRLPKGIARLTSLRTLEVIDVGCDHGDKISLGDLKNLNQLRGRLNIINLGAHSRHVGEAKEAELKKKEHITFLVLGFQPKEEGKGEGEEEEEEEGEGEGEGEEDEREEEEEHLLEALEPSPNLEILKIGYYKGTTFPGWMISLTNLRSIKLSHCNWCSHLPSLGKLPSLEALKLYWMKGVKKVGVELLGIETQIGDRMSEISAPSSSSSSFSLPVVVAFPKLTKLRFSSMHSWEEWDDCYNYNDGTTKPPAIKIMPSLCSLEITDCGNLKALPDYILQNTMLHTLKISFSNLLEECYNKDMGEDWSKISHIPHVTISSSWF